MNNSIYGIAIAALPLFAAIAQAGESPAGHYTTADQAEVTITRLAAGKHVGSVKVRGGAEYSLKQAKPLNSAESSLELVFVIQPTKRRPPATSSQSGRSARAIPSLRSGTPCAIAGVATK